MLFTEKCMWKILFVCNFLFWSYFDERSSIVDVTICYGIVRTIQTNKVLKTVRCILNMYLVFRMTRYFLISSFSQQFHHFFSSLPEKQDRKATKTHGLTEFERQPIEGNRQFTANKKNWITEIENVNWRWI